MSNIENPFGELRSLLAMDDVDWRKAAKILHDVSEEEKPSVWQQLSNVAMMRGQWDELSDAVRFHKQSPVRQQALVAASHGWRHVFGSVVLQHLYENSNMRRLYMDDLTFNVDCGRWQQPSTSACAWSPSTGKSCPLHHRLERPGRFRQSQGDMVIFFTGLQAFPHDTVVEWCVWKESRKITAATNRL